MDTFGNDNAAELARGVEEQVCFVVFFVLKLFFKIFSFFLACSKKFVIECKSKRITSIIITRSIFKR